MHIAYAVPCKKHRYGLTNANLKHEKKKAHNELKFIEDIRKLVGSKNWSKRMLILQTMKTDSWNAQILIVSQREHWEKFVP